MLLFILWCCLICSGCFPKAERKHGPCPGELCIIERAVSALPELRALQTSHSSHSENCLRLKGVPGIMQTTPTTATDWDLFNLPRATTGGLEEMPQCPLRVCSNCCNSSWNYDFFFPNIYTKCSLLQPQAITAFCVILLMRVFDVCCPSEHPFAYPSAASLSPPRNRPAQGSPSAAALWGLSAAPVSSPVFISACTNEHSTQESLSLPLLICTTWAMLSTPPGPLSSLQTVISEGSQPLTQCGAL